MGMGVGCRGGAVGGRQLKTVGGGMPLWVTRVGRHSVEVAGIT